LDALPTLGGPLAGLMVGIIGGVVSGTLGVTSGGLLVPLSVLLLGAEQHVAQGISLIAQVPPTSWSGVRDYARHGRTVSLRALALVAGGFVAGSLVGAHLAEGVDGRVLKWSFVGYLALLDVVLILRRAKSEAAGTEVDARDVRARWPALVAIGLVAGVSSGFLGIGGGFAITVLSIVALRALQHQAQALSLAVTALPVTLPAAWEYVRQGWDLPILVIGGIIVGLWIGTMAGSRIANKLVGRDLRYVLIAVIGAMAMFMAWKAAS